LYALLTFGGGGGGGGKLNPLITTGKLLNFASNDQARCGVFRSKLSEPNECDDINGHEHLDLSGNNTQVYAVGKNNVLHDLLAQSQSRGRPMRLGKTGVHQISAFFTSFTTNV
jgi:hypothetical protein